jgi:DNA-binding MarR family transcriptional regulator
MGGLATEPVQAKDVSPSELGHLYLELHHRFRRTIDEAMTAAGLSLSRAKLLAELTEYGPMNQAALATRLGFAPRSVTETVDTLTRDGLAVRSLDPDDRRARIVAITPAGSIALAHAMAGKKAAMEQIFGTLEPPARTQFAALLTALRTSLTSPTPGASNVE